MATGSKKIQEMEIVQVERSDRVCVFCKQGTVDEVNLGKLYSRDGVVSHYYCLLFASNLCTKGKKDSDGILGFLLPDIQNEVRRAVSNKVNKRFYSCAFCRMEGATIGCCEKKCKKIFHFPCGLANGADYKFSTFGAYCMNHAKLPDLRNVPQDDVCLFCNCKLNNADAATSSSKSRERSLVLGTCCTPTLYHKLCLQKYALSAGLHAFKCPKCNSKTLNTQVQSQGIYLPDQDASWELEDNAFGELYVEIACESNPCICVKGRNFSGDTGSEWHLILCSNCGAVCTHRKCGAVNSSSETDWTCEICKEFQSHRAKNVTIPQESTRVISLSRESNNLSSSLNLSSPSLTNMITSPLPRATTIHHNREVMYTDDVDGGSKGNISSNENKIIIKNQKGEILSDLEGHNEVFAGRTDLKRVKDRSERFSSNTVATASRVQRSTKEPRKYKNMDDIKKSKFSQHRSSFPRPPVHWNTNTSNATTGSGRNLNMRLSFELHLTISSGTWKAEPTSDFEIMQRHSASSSHSSSTENDAEVIPGDRSSSSSAKLKPVKKQSLIESPDIVDAPKQPNRRSSRVRKPRKLDLNDDSVEISAPPIRTPRKHKRTKRNSDNMGSPKNDTKKLAMEKLGTPVLTHPATTTTTVEDDEVQIIAVLSNPTSKLIESDISTDIESDVEVIVVPPPASLPTILTSPPQQQAKKRRKVSRTKFSSGRKKKPAGLQKMRGIPKPIMPMI